MEQNEKQIILSISDLWSIFTGHIISIIVSVVLAFFIVLCYSLISYEPEYTSTSAIYLIRQDRSDSSSAVSSSDFSLALSTVNDCKYLLTNIDVLNEVIEVLGMPLTYEDLLPMVNIYNPPSTRILEISITAPNPMDAKIIVDELCNIGAESIMKALGIDQVNIVNKGRYNENPSNSILTPYLGVIPLLTALAVYGIYLLIYILDDKIKTPEDIEKYIGLTVLGIIPYKNREMESAAINKNKIHQV